MGIFSKVFQPKAHATASGPNFLGRITKNFTRPIAMSDEERTLLFMMCSLLLDYPHDQVASTWETIGEQAGNLPAEAAEGIQNFLTVAKNNGVRQMQEDYVATFDQRRRLLYVPQLLFRR